MNADSNGGTMGEHNEHHRDDAEDALTRAHISNSRLLEFAENHPPPNWWFEGEEEDLF
jgi:hypothetical protein